MKTAIALLCSLASFSAAASGTIVLQGTEFQADTVAHYYIGPGITHTHLSLSTPTRMVQVFAATLDRNDPSYTEAAKPRIVIGKDQCRIAETVSSMGTRSTTAERQYLTGINGDFFITSSFAGQHEFGNAILGYPNMSCVIDGKIAAPDMIDIASRENALIIGRDGDMWIDATDLTYKLLNNDGSVQVKATAVNYPRRAGELMVYNSYIGATTGTTGGREIALRPADGTTWKVNATTKFIVDGTWQSGGNMAVPADGIVISCGDDYHNEFIDGLAEGDVVKLKIILSLPAFDKIKPDITDVIGGDVRILNCGQVTTEAIRWINTPGSQYPRSLTGYSQDRSKLVIAAVDGGQSASTGLSYYESADLMAALGCYDALDLDGGGSTALWTSHAGIVSHPRDGSERAVGNALFFAIDAPADATVSSIRFADPAVVLPLRASYRPVIYGYNRYGQLVDTDVDGVTLSAPAADAEIRAGKVIPTSGNPFALKASLGSMEATIAVSVDSEANIDIANNSILLDRVRTAKPSLFAMINGRPVEVANEAYTWTSENPEIAEVDPITGTISAVSEGTTRISGRPVGMSQNNKDNTVINNGAIIGVTVQFAKAPLMPLEPAIGGTGWKMTRTGIGADATMNTDADGLTTLDFAITNKRGTALTLSNNITAYSLPDGFTTAIDPCGTGIKELTLRVHPANSSQPVAVSAGAVNAAGTVDFDLGSAIDLNDINVYPIRFVSLRMDISGAPEGAERCTVRLHDTGFTYTHFESGVHNVATGFSGATLPLNISADTIETMVPATHMELYSTSGVLVAASEGTALPRPAAAGIYIVRACTASGMLTAKVVLR